MWWFAVAFAGDPAVPASAVVVSGTLTLAPDRAADASKATALFISVRDPAGGPPLAAVKLAPGPFPMSFSVTEANAIPMGGAPRPFPEAVDVSIRLDQDGDPLTKDDGLPAATLPAIKKGSAGMSVALK